MNWFQKWRQPKVGQRWKVRQSIHDRDWLVKIAYRKGETVGYTFCMEPTTDLDAETRKELPFGELEVDAFMNLYVRS